MNMATTRQRRRHGQVRWIPFFVPENGLYLLRFGEALEAELRCLQQVQGAEVGHGEPW